MKYAPWPWRKYTGKLRPQFPVLIHEIHDGLGREVVKWGGFDGLDLPKSTTAANVRLMAASPELLYCARRSLIFMDELSAAGNKEATILRDELKAIIRKAVGQERRRPDRTASPK